MAERLVVAGAGIVPFVAADVHGDIAERAIRNALADADVDAELIDQAVTSRACGDAAAGERALARAGLSGIAIANVSNGSASGSVALFHARQALLSGEAECVVAVGFEQTRHLPAIVPHAGCVATFDWLAEKRGIGDDVLARVAVKARSHGARSPYAVHREPLSLEEARTAPLLAGRVRRSYVSEPACGAAAVVLCTPRFAAAHGLRDDVLLVAHLLESGDPADASRRQLADPIDGSTTRRVAERAYESAGVDPEDIDVAEVHDCCVADEVIACAALGLCGPHDIDAFVRSGANTYGGSVVVSPSGGMLSMGDVPGATGIARTCELAWQLRGRAAGRQVEGARVAVQHNGTPGGAVAVSILMRNS